MLIGGRIAVGRLACGSSLSEGPLSKCLLVAMAKCKSFDVLVYQLLTRCQCISTSIFNINWPI